MIFSGELLINIKSPYTWKPKAYSPPMLRRAPGQVRIPDVLEILGQQECGLLALFSILSAWVLDQQILRRPKSLPSSDITVGSRKTRVVENRLLEAEAQSELCLDSRESAYFGEVYTERIRVVATEI